MSRANARTSPREHGPGFADQPAHELAWYQLLPYKRRSVRLSG